MIISAGIASLIIWLLITLMSRGTPAWFYERIASVLPAGVRPFLEKIQHGFYYDVANEMMPAEIFFVLFSLIFLIYFLVIIRISKNTTRANYFFSIFCFAVLFRLMLIPSTLIHENDIYRYIWEGKVFLSGVNPYKYAPQQAMIMPEEADKQQEFMKLKALRNEDHVSYERIGHKKVPTIYPPAAQGLFAFSNVLRRGSLSTMKLLFVLFDIAVIVAIYRLLLHFNKNPNMIVVYAWSPLVLKEYANSGHFDPAPLFFLIVSLFFFFRNKIASSRIALALGILFKFFPIVILPFLGKRLKVKSMCIIGGIVGAAYLPFFLWGKIEPLQVFRGLIVYSKIWFFNGAIFECFYSLSNLANVSMPFDSVILIKIILSCIYIGILIFLFKKREETDDILLKKIFWALAWLFLLSPVGDPWYFCFVIPFLCFFPYRSFIVLSWLLIFSYLSFSRTIGDIAMGNFSFSKLILVQYLPFYLLFVKETVFARKSEKVHVS